MSINIFLVGPMGAGKTTIGKNLAKSLNCDFYDSDQIIESRTGADLAWIYDLEGEDGFRQREEKVIDELTQKDNIILATGGTVVLSPNNRKLLMARGTVIYLKASIDQQVERTKVTNRRPLLRSKTDLRTRLKELHDELEHHYQDLADHILNTEGLSIKNMSDKIISALNL